MDFNLFRYGSTLLYAETATVGQVFTTIFSVVTGAFALGIAAPHLATIATARGAAATVFEVIDSVSYANNFEYQSVNEYFFRTLTSVFRFFFVVK